MANGFSSKKKHFILEGVTNVESYRFPLRSIKRKEVPERDRELHGKTLQSQIHELWAVADNTSDSQRDAGIKEGLGLQIEFESFPDVEMAFESLARERWGIELHNVRHHNDRTFATVFVPDGKLQHFEDLVYDYLAEKRDRAGRARDNRRLIDAIRQIRTASLRALWTDTSDSFPSQEEGSFWWEVWLPVRRDRDTMINMFREQAKLNEMRVMQGEIKFPERTVLLVYTSVNKMERSIVTLNCIAELRRAKETAEFFDSLPVDQQSEWLQNLEDRMQLSTEFDHTPYICLLDTGVNRGHTLLLPALDTDDLHTVNPAWGTDDANGHGTQMAGLALAGDLTELLEGDEVVEIEHRLESVKLLHQDGMTGTDPYHHGYLTIEAVARPEVTSPFRPRVFGMAITARDNRDRGRPSAWSAALDFLAADVDGSGTNPRLLVVSAGNITANNDWLNYPHSNETDSVHDPAQSWNALTIGAYTNLVQITEPDADHYTPIAPEGGLSPFSTTSLTWQPHWPLKPDVVLEGGNAATDGTPSAVWMRSLSLLTTHHRPIDRLFTTTNATSAATALASRLAAQIMCVYPKLWPETIRALIVHSAEWTSTMKRSFLPSNGRPTKQDFVQLIRRCGFGVPNLNQALWSVTNSLTMVIEESLHPFKQEKGKQPTLCDMHLHSLPWPRDILESLGETEVEMRVTLSYFIEPNPSERGFRSRYRYQSHGLRFDVKRPHESTDEFRRRVNAAARNEEDKTERNDSDDPLWLIGTQGRHKGSIHSDIWRGAAADLASRGNITVYPTAGWWKTRPALGKYTRSSRYALIISIKAPEIKTDIYTEVANQINMMTEVKI